MSTKIELSTQVQVHGNLPMATYRITGAGDPVGAQDYVTLAYLQANSQPLDSDLTAIAALATTGLVTRTGSGTAAARTITGTSNQITVTNGDGVSGNPTLSLPSTLVLPDGTTATTQSQLDGTMKVATTAYVDTALASAGTNDYGTF